MICNLFIIGWHQCDSLWMFRSRTKSKGTESFPHQLFTLLIAHFFVHKKRQNFSASLLIDFSLPFKSSRIHIHSKDPSDSLLLLCCSIQWKNIFKLISFLLRLHNVFKFPTTTKNGIETNSLCSHTAVGATRKKGKIYICSFGISLMLYNFFMYVKIIAWLVCTIYSFFPPSLSHSLTHSPPEGLHAKPT